MTPGPSQWPRIIEDSSLSGPEKGFIAASPLSQMARPRLDLSGYDISSTFPTEFSVQSRPQEDTALTLGKVSVPSSVIGIGGVKGESCRSSKLVVGTLIRFIDWSH